MSRIVALVELVGYESLERRQSDFLHWTLHRQISSHLSEHRP